MPAHLTARELIIATHRVIVHDSTANLAASWLREREVTVQVTTPLELLTFPPGFQVNHHLAVGSIPPEHATHFQPPQGTDLSWFGRAGPGLKGWLLAYSREPCHDLWLGLSAVRNLVAMRHFHQYLRRERGEAARVLLFGRPSEEQALLNAHLDADEVAFVLLDAWLGGELEAVCRVNTMLTLGSSIKFGEVVVQIKRQY